MSVRRYHARWVVRMAGPPVEHGTVCVDGSRIVFVGSRAEAPPGTDIELGDQVLVPGLVNAHTHLDLTAMRGTIDGGEFFTWVRTLVAHRAELSPEETRDSARAGVAEGLLAGVTTFADTAPSLASFDAMLDFAVRGIAYHEVFGPDPAQCVGAMSTLAATLSPARERETALVRLGVSPHAPYSVSDALYEATSAFARRENLPIACHIAESDDEVTLVRDGTGAFAEFLASRKIAVAARARSPIRLLDARGVLGETTLLIHCVQCTDDDVATIARHGCGVATCPTSNEFLWLGGARSDAVSDDTSRTNRAPVRAIHEAGIRLGVGSDSAASSPSMNVLREAVTTAQRAAPDKDGLAPAKLSWHLATLDGARALGLDREVGSLEAGKQADLAAFPIEHVPGLTPQGSLKPSADALVIDGRAPRASLVVVAGRERIRDFQFVPMAADEGGRDLASLAARAGERTLVCNKRLRVR